MAEIKALNVTANLGALRYQVRLIDTALEAAEAVAKDGLVREDSILASFRRQPDDALDALDALDADEVIHMNNLEFALRCLVAIRTVKAERKA